MASPPSLEEATMQNTKWTTLPLEVRLKIYRYLFIARRSISFEPTEADSPCPPLEVPHLSSQLLRCNKAILAEAQPILYSNVFDLRIWDDIFRCGKHDRDPHGVFADETKRAFWKSQLRHIAMENCSPNCRDLVAQIVQMPQLQSIQIRLMSQYGLEFKGDMSETRLDEYVQKHGQNWRDRNLVQMMQVLPHADFYYCIHGVESKKRRMPIGMLEDVWQGPILRYRMDETELGEPRNTFAGGYTLDDHPIPTKSRRNHLTHAAALEELRYALTHRRYTLLRR